MKEYPDIDIIKSFIYISDYNISEPSGRSDILRYLIEKDTNWEKLKALVDLVNMWPLSSVDDEK